MHRQTFIETLEGLSKDYCKSEYKPGQWLIRHYAEAACIISHMSDVITYTSHRQYFSVFVKYKNKKEALKYFDTNINTFSWTVWNVNYK